jgi:hypothetical protein
VVGIKSVQIPRHGVELVLVDRCLDEWFRQAYGAAAKGVLFCDGDRRQSSSAATESAELTVRFQMNSPVDHGMAVLLIALYSRAVRGQYTVAAASSGGGKRAHLQGETGHVWGKELPQASV